ncbi:MAG TPA: BspA family leucine-rich repeat surface protein, partial [Gallicola sp.]|nr:BspA family leucine-rich repeat surface protein [Gallicola sp.]
MKRKAFVLVSILICSIFLNFTYANANGLNENSRKILKEGKWKNSKWEYYDNGEIVFYLGALSTVEEAPWNNGDLNKDDIRIINFSAKSKAPIDMSYLFSGFENLKEINNLKNLDVKETTNMSHLFDGVKVKEIDISRWKTGYLKDTSYMFSNIKNIEKLDVSNLHTNNVTNMSYMFADSNFEEIDLSNFNTGKVKDLNNIFLNTPYLNKLVLGTTFRFKGNTGLEKGINPYTDSWKGLEKEFLYPSTEEFIKKYDGNKPDTYCRVLEKYKVEFNNSFGKILDSQEVEYGSKLNKIENPEREGYKFTYWSTDKEGVNEFDFETPISKNTTLYAQWEKGMDVYKVTYDGNGATSGEVPTDNIDYGHGSLVTVKGNIGNLVRNDYIFDGWAKDPLGNDTVEDTFIITEDTTLYAQWVLDTSGSGVVYVTFEPNGGVFSDGTIESKVVEVAKGETVLEEDILKEGYIFKGWYLEDETKYNFELEVIENLKLFAKWEKDSTMPTEPSNPSEPTKPTEPTKPERPTPTIKEITLVGGRATLTERVESQLMDFVQYRLSGKDRYATSVAVAKEYSKSNIVLLASGEKYTDELTATVLANKLDAPIMLTRKDAIPAEVKAEINRLGATKVILIGGNASISEKVEKELANYTV